MKFYGFLLPAVACFVIGLFNHDNGDAFVTLCVMGMIFAALAAIFIND